MTLETEVRGTKFEVEVTSDGQFRAILNGYTFGGDTLQKLKDKLNGAMAQNKKHCSIPFYRASNDKVIRGTITGKHAGNKNLLIKWENGKTEQEYYYTSKSSDMFLALTNGSLQEYTRILAEFVKARDAKHRFEQTYGFDANAAVEKALANQV